MRATTYKDRCLLALQWRREGLVVEVVAARLGVTVGTAHVMASHGRKLEKRYSSRAPGEVFRAPGDSPPASRPTGGGVCATAVAQANALCGRLPAGQSQSARPTEADAPTPEWHDKARALRAKGWSVKGIAKRLERPEGHVAALLGVTWGGSAEAGA